MAGIKRLLRLTVFICILFACQHSFCLAAGKVIILSLNRTSLKQIAADPALGDWLDRGAVALLNVSTAVRPVTEHAYVTLGAGSRAAGTEFTRLAFNSREEYSGLPAASVFMRHHRREPIGRVLQLSVAATESANAALQHPVVPGLLGETLRTGGKVTAVLGNSDGSGYFRDAAAMLADRSGEVALGDVSRALLASDPLFPYGHRLDQELLWSAFSELWPAADVLLIDWGDTTRLDEYRPLLGREACLNLQRQIFRDAALFLDRVSKELDGSDILIVISPSPPAGESGSGLLTYLAVHGAGFPAGSFLTSGTTRRPGVIAAVDVAPFILERVGLSKPAMMLGRTITSGGEGTPLELLGIQADIGRLFRLRPPLLKTYVFLQIVIVLGALLNLLVRFARTSLFEPLLFALLVFPLAVLYLPLYAMSTPLAFVVTGAAIIVTVTALKYFLPFQVARFAAIGLLTSFSLAIDIFRDAGLMKLSVLGYDVVSGARFYGLGNEYMGVMVGSALLGTASLASLMPHRRRLLLTLCAIFFLFLILLIVSPAGGANFGGTVTAMAAFFVMLLVGWQVRPGWRSGTVMVLLFAAIGVLAVYLNLRVPEAAQSHLGRTLALFGSTGRQAFYDVIARKAAMNARLFRYSQWSRAFLVFLAVLTVLFYRPKGVLKHIRVQYPVLSAGFFGIIAGSITAFLVNDSGVVAAATTLLYAGVPIILLSARAERIN